MTQTRDILERLSERRKALCMSCDVLAKRSGLSVRTVQRVLSGEAQDLRLGSVLAIAHALGADIGITKEKRPSTVRQRQARTKAQHLASLAQGTAALEGLAVPRAALRDVARRIEAKLLAGPSIRLWS